MLSVLSFLLTMVGCAATVVKTQAIDDSVLERSPVASRYVTAPRERERQVIPHTGWLGDVDPAAALTFAGLRLDGGGGDGGGRDGGGIVYVLVLVCDPVTDRLVLLPLGDGRFPLDVLEDARERARLEEITGAVAGGSDLPDGALVLSLVDVIANRRLGPPLPTPRHVYAVAANYPSHLMSDLALPAVTPYRDVIRDARARVFLKYPPVPPPSGGETPDAGAHDLVGPFDKIVYPGEIDIPPDEPRDPVQRVETCFDYEVEIGLVMGRALDWDQARAMSDEELRAAVAGLVLVSDAKARNPQVALRMTRRGAATDPDSPYAIDDGYLNRAVGVWDETTVAWWSYAAGAGRVLSVGPFFVATVPDFDRRPRAMIAARSYAPEEERGAAVPRGLEPGTLYLRQCSETTEDIDHRDALLWTAPQVIRSILAPDGALPEDAARLEPGDIICLGTPGGTVITSRSPRVVDLLRNVLFFWAPHDFHDKFFADTANLYLRGGDEVFMWVEGLGFQWVTVRRGE